MRVKWIFYGHRDMVVVSRYYVEGILYYILAIGMYNGRRHMLLSFPSSCDMANRINTLIDVLIQEFALPAKICQKYNSSLFVYKHI